VKRYHFKFDFDYNDFLIEITLPIIFEHKTEEDAINAAKAMEVRLVLLPRSAVCCFKFKSKQFTKLFQLDDYAKVYMLNDEAHQRLGKPLSKEDIDGLVEQGSLEKVIFSDAYMTTESDYEIVNEKLSKLYNRINSDKKRYVLVPTSFSVEELRKCSI